MDKPLNAGLVGYGYAGRTLHAPLIAASRGMRLGAIVTRQSEQAGADWPGVALYQDVEALLQDHSIDLVVIATPNDTHYDLARRALLADKHVAIDKPFATSLSQARDLLHLAQERKLLLSVFHNRRWDADFLTLQHLLSRSALGEVVYFESHFDRFRPQVQQRWREQGALGGGLWYDLGPHLIDQALQLFGPPLAVYADLETQRVGAQAVDYFHVLLRYERLRVVLHGANLVSGGSPRFLVHGTQASYVKYGLDTQESMLKQGVTPGAAGWGYDPIPGLLITGKADKAEEQRVGNLDGDYRRYYEDLAASWARGTPPLVNMWEAARVMAIVELALTSNELKAEQAFQEPVKNS